MNAEAAVLDPTTGQQHPLLSLDAARPRERQSVLGARVGKVLRVGAMGLGVLTGSMVVAELGVRGSRAYEDALAYGHQHLAEEARSALARGEEPKPWSDARALAAGMRIASSKTAPDRSRLHEEGHRARAFRNSLGAKPQARAATRDRMLAGLEGAPEPPKHSGRKAGRD
jgi:hypothetical protein